MILKASQRGGPRQLAAHLLNPIDNDHVLVAEVRGFISGDLNGAMAETVAIARGTRCRQPILSLSLNPPKDADASVDDLTDAANRAEAALGLDGQPRAIVIHEKNGRRHAHVVWSRIDASEMKAVNLPYFKKRLATLSKELYLDHGWVLPEGHRESGWKNPLNFTLAEWQQAKRHDLDPREIKQQFRDAWEQSDGPSAFKNALEERGYYLARGDRRGLVAVDLNGEVYAVARACGVKTKEVTQRLGDGSNLNSVADTQKLIERLKTARVREKLAEDKNQKERESKPLREQLRMLKSHHLKERATLKERQHERHIAETKERAGRFRRGLGAVLDVLTGRLFAIRKQNESEAYEAFLRDKDQRETLAREQLRERRELQDRLDRLERQQRERSRERIRNLLGFARPRTRPRSLDFDR